MKNGKFEANDFDDTWSQSKAATYQEVTVQANQLLAEYVGTLHSQLQKAEAERDRVAMDFAKSALMWVDKIERRAEAALRAISTKSFDDKDEANYPIKVFGSQKQLVERARDYFKEQKGTE